MTVNQFPGSMKSVSILLIAVFFAGCAQDSDGEGSVYSGKAALNAKLHQFIATNEDTNKEVILTMTGPSELSFSFNDKLSHIDYEKDVIIIRSDADTSEWSARRVRGGFELEDGTRLGYGKCQGWAICLQDGDNIPILKGKYSLQGNGAEITLWISDREKHVELLGLMANALLNKSRNTKQSVDSALETLSSQVWTF
jgi:hypothetical protein